MKKILLIWLLCAGSFTQANSGNNEIESFMDFSSDIIDQAIMEMEDRRNVIVFEHPDYQRAFLQHAERVENSLLEFNERLNVEILDGLRFLVNRYNSLYRASHYTDEQKARLLRNEFDAIERYLDRNTELYHHMIKDLVRSIFPVTTSYQVIEQNVGRFRMKKRFNYCQSTRRRKTGRIRVEWTYAAFQLDRPQEIKRTRVRYRARTNGCVAATQWFQKGGGSASDGPFVHGASHERDMNRSQRERFWSQLFDYYLGTVNLDITILNFNEMRSRCESRACVLMYGVDIVQSFRFIEEQINRSLEIRLADGRRVSLPQAELSEYGLVDRIEEVFDVLNDSDLPFSPSGRN